MAEPLSSAAEKIAQANMPTEAHRRLWLYTIVHGGLNGAARELGLSTTTLHNYLHAKHMPRGGAMLALQQKSAGRVPLWAWGEEPKGPWPVKDPSRAFARLSEGSRKPLVDAAGAQ